MNPRANQEKALEIIGAAVSNLHTSGLNDVRRIDKLEVTHERVYHQDAEKQDDGLEHVKLKGHGAVHGPAQKDEEGGYEERDLQRAADDDLDGQIDLPPLDHCRVATASPAFPTMGTIIRAMNDLGMPSCSTKPSTLSMR